MDFDYKIFGSYPMNKDIEKLEGDRMDKNKLQSLSLMIPLLRCAEGS